MKRAGAIRFAALLAGGLLFVAACSSSSHAAHSKATASTEGTTTLSGAPASTTNSSHGSSSKTSSTLSPPNDAASPSAKNNTAPVVPPANSPPNTSSPTLQLAGVCARGETVHGVLQIIGGPANAPNKPIAGTVSAARVVTVDPGALPSCTTTVGPNGQFTMTLPNGEYYFTGRSPLFHSGMVDCTADGPIDVGVTGSNQPPVSVRCDARPPVGAPAG